MISVIKKNRISPSSNFPYFSFYRWSVLQSERNGCREKYFVFNRTMAAGNWNPKKIATSLVRAIFMVRERIFSLAFFLLFSSFNYTNMSFSTYFLLKNAYGQYLSFLELLTQIELWSFFFGYSCHDEKWVLDWKWGQFLFVTE